MNLKRLSLGLLAAIAFACPSLAGELAAPEDRLGHAAVPGHRRVIRP